MKTAMIACIAGSLPVFALVAYSQQTEPKVPLEATADGNYSDLLRTIKVPEDERTYGRFFDYGYYAAGDYAGHKDLPAGFWVYVAPNWYIWKESKTP